MNSAKVWRHLGFGAVVVTLGVLLSASAAHRPPLAETTPSGDEVVVTLDSAESKVHWILGSSLHTVHGTFTLKRGALRFEPESGRASGEIVADATSGESGNDSRDKKMHKEVLESARFTEVVFRPDRVEGKVPAEGAASIQLHGMLVLHGSEHEITVPVQAELANKHWKGSAKFSVPYVQWGLKNPSNFFLKADHTVNIELEMTGGVQKTP